MKDAVLIRPGLKLKKEYSLFPIVLMLLALRALMILKEVSALSYFIYVLF
jgi:hypothetical protein